MVPSGAVGGIQRLVRMTHSLPRTVPTSFLFELAATAIPTLFGTLLPTQRQLSGLRVMLGKLQGNPEEKSGLRGLGEGLLQFITNATYCLQIIRWITDNCCLSGAKLVSG